MWYKRRGNVGCSPGALSRRCRFGIPIRCRVENFTEANDSAKGAGGGGGGASRYRPARETTENRTRRVQKASTRRRFPPYPKRGVSQLRAGRIPFLFRTCHVIPRPSIGNIGRSDTRIHTRARGENRRLPRNDHETTNVSFGKSRIRRRLYTFV